MQYSLKTFNNTIDISVYRYGIINGDKYWGWIEGSIEEVEAYWLYSINELLYISHEQWG